MGVDQGENRPPFDNERIPSQTDPKQRIGRNRFVIDGRVIAGAGIILLLAAGDLTNIPQQVVASGRQAVGAWIKMDNEVVAREANVLGGVTKAKQREAEAIQAAALTEEARQAALIVDISLPGHPAKITAEEYRQIAEAVLSGRGLNARTNSIREIIEAQRFTIGPLIPYKQVQYFRAAEDTGSAVRPAPSLDDQIGPQVDGVNAGHPFPGYGFQWMVDSIGRRWLFILTSPRVNLAVGGEGQSNLLPTFTHGRWVEPRYVLVAVEIANQFFWITAPLPDTPNVSSQALVSK